MKKRLSLLLSLAIIFTFIFLPSSHALAAPSFPDIEGSPYFEAIENLVALGVVNGNPDGSFLPENDLSRAEAAALIQRAFRLYPIIPLVTEEDIIKRTVYGGALESINEAFLVPAAKDATDHWAQGSIEAIINAGIAGVDELNQFNPNASITEDEFVTMLAKAFIGAGEADAAERLATMIAGGDLDMGDDPVTVGVDTPLTRGRAAAALAMIICSERYIQLQVFATSDIHGHLDSYTPGGSAVQIGSVAKMSYILNEMRKLAPDLILVDCGDAPYNTTLVNVFEGRPAIEIMNEMGYDAMALGNHDFDMSINVMITNAGLADFPFLSANTYYKDGTFPDHLGKSVIVEVDGLKIGIIGLVDDTTKETTHFTNTEDIDFLDDLAMGRELIPALAAETDLVIALSHLHSKNNVLPKEVGGIDISIGGGQDVVGPPIKINDSYLISPGKHAEALNQIVVNMWDGEMLGIVFNQIFLGPHMPDDPVVAAIVDGYLSLLDERLQEVVGVSETDLDGERATVRFRESNLGNLVADSQRAFFETDFAIQNGGGIRASVPAGELTLSNVFSIVPFDNGLVVLEVSGQTVWDVLENGVSDWGTAHGKFPHVSGLSYVFDAEAENGERIVAVKLPDGSDIDLNARYTIVVNDFMAGGGDGYFMLNALNPEHDQGLAEDVTLLLETREFQRDILARYLRSEMTVAPVLEGRITILNEPEP